ncbi:MAG: prepilin-type N-terminal cleavage/methylation domain-containing protein [Succinivibrionaceae bacterium]|nr:prepilin-type N-terminal cleavage/methylation domain-containing protein [Succinivibrionaceae bacterium]
MMVKQKGFGLIELMISLLVSVIIMAGLYGLLTSSIVNFGFSKASSDAVDTAHRVDNFFNVLLFQAGFINFERAINAEGWVAGAVNLPDAGVSFPAWEADQFVYAEDNNSILIRYYGSSVDDDTTHHVGIDADESNGFITDCGGVAVGRETLVTAYFTANENGLICQYNDRTNNQDTNPDDIVLDASVRSLMFEFGSTWDPKFANDDGFFTAGEINGSNGNLKWSHVDIVRYSFITSQPSNQRLIKSRQDTLRHFNMPNSTVGSGEEGDAGTAPANNVDYNYQIPDNERSNVHRVITGTIYLVNASKTVGEN